MAGTRATSTALLTLSLALPVSIVGCDTSDTARPVRLGAAQVLADGRLRVLFGDTCTNVTAVSVALSRNRTDGPDTELDTWTVGAVGDAASLDEVTLGDVPEGYRETDGLRADWRDADFVRVRIDVPDDDLGLTLDAPELVAQAPDHQGEWYVNNLSEVTGGDASSGWYTEDGYRDLLDPDDGIVPLCGS